MNGITGYKMTPLFISSDVGSLFGVHFSPNSNDSKQCIIYLPAFAEEMNKTRHMVTMQARAFAEQGYAVLVLDLWGTGDSQGDFAEATWEIWLHNVGTAIEWMQNQGYSCINLWGLRTGTLLAIDFLHRNDSLIDSFICWQPVLNGEQFVMQFLRLRIAAAMMDKTTTQEKTSDLKEQLLSGNNIEVAGYSLNPQLIIPMLSLQARLMSLSDIKQCYLFELKQGQESEGNRVTTQWAKQLTESGVKVSFDVVNDQPFWATQDISESLSLLKITSKRIAECR